MALVTRSATAHVDGSYLLYAPQIAGLKAGADIDPCAPCYVNADGLVYMSNGTAANAAAKVDGWNARVMVRAGQAVTLLVGPGIRFGYGSGLTPGATLFLGATAGRLDTAATTGDAVGIAKVINATDIITKGNPT